MNQGVRRRGRELALKLIYSFRRQRSSEDVEKTIADFWNNFRFEEDILGDALDEVDRPVPFEVKTFAESLVRGVVENLDQIDSVIGEYSTNWALDRMARVDLALLRLGTYELLFHPEVPGSVVINEAIEIGKRFGTRETPAFVNGILDRISHVHRPPKQ